MKKFIAVILLLFLSSNYLFSQCWFTVDTSRIPLTPWTNGYMNFKAWTTGKDASGTLCHTKYHESLQLLGDKLDSFYIEWKMKIRHGVTREMWIFGNYYDHGWAISYNRLYNQFGVVEDTGWVELWTDSNFTRNGNVTKIYQLGNTDSNWHTYKVLYNKGNQTLSCYFDGSLQNTYTNYRQFAGNNTNYTFTVGHRWAYNTVYQFGTNYIPHDDNYFEGYIDFIKIKRWNSVATPDMPELVYWPFNEGAGQFIHDSVTFKTSDWTIPGFPNLSCGFHLLNGISYARDSFDGIWFREGSYTSSLSPMGSGIAFWGGPNYNVWHWAFGLGLYVWDSLLIVMGHFNRINVTNYSYDNGDTAYRIAKWNGTTWSKLGNGFNHEGEKAIEYRDTLIVTGIFDSIMGGPKVNYIAKYDGNSWSGLGSGLENEMGLVAWGLSLATWGDSLYVGGYFNKAGGINANRIAKWNGSTWDSLGSGCSYAVWTMAVYNNKLYVGGEFIKAGGKTCNGIAVWNGASWDTVGTGTMTSGGSNGIVYALYVFNDTLWAGGVFETMNGITCNNVAFYDGYNWHNAGAGSSSYGNNCMGADVDNITQHCGNLYFSGNFYYMDEKPVYKICRYNGSDFCPVNFGFDTRCKDMVSYPAGPGNYNLIITGDMQWGDGISISCIASIDDGSCDAPNFAPTALKTSLLYQNYPNPFNPVTSIKYYVLIRGLVKIRIYDVIGRELKTLVNEFKEPGVYNVDFDATNYASGVYFYKFETGDLTEVKKMVLIK